VIKQEVINDEDSAFERFNNVSNGDTKYRVAITGGKFVLWHIHDCVSQ